jgi:hypothetical protein
MQANPDKFQVIAVEESLTFKINTSRIICDETVKLLGI